MSDWNDAIAEIEAIIQQKRCKDPACPRDAILLNKLANLKRPAEMEGDPVDQVRKIIRKLRYMNEISQPKEAAWDVPYMTALADVERELPTLSHSEGDKR